MAAALSAAMAVAVPGAATAQTGCDGGADFNGDNCGDDLIGDPAATVNGKVNAGRINVLYGSATGTGTRAVLAQGQAGVADTAETDDLFGAVVQVMRVDGDQYADLVVGVPRESVGTTEDAGIIQVIYGSAGGLGAGRPGLVLRQGLFEIPGGPEPGDQFGAAVRANKTEHTSGDAPAPALAWGAPGEDIGSTADAGSAGLITFGQTGGVVAAGGVNQDSPGISGAVEAGDRFGQAIDVFQGPSGFSCPVSGTRGLTMVVGVPGEDFGTTRDAGMVHVVRNLAGDSLLSQDEPAVEGTPEAGDQFGSAVAVASECEHDGPLHVRLVAGTPGEDIGAVADAGMIHYFGTDDEEIPLPHRWSVHQNSIDVADQSEAGDSFGSVLALGGPWRGDNIGESIVVGVPREDVGTAVDGGAVHVFGDSLNAPGSTDLFTTQAHVGAQAETGDQFAAAVAVAQGRLLVGAPDDVTHDKGVVHGIPWEPTGTVITFVPGQDGIPADAVRFGASVG
jgi:hypothetical protein